MKKYLLVILFLSIGFGQDVLITNSGTEYKGKMINKDKYEIEFQIEGQFASQYVKTETIKSLILADGTVVISSGYVFGGDSDKNTTDSFALKASKFATIGGALIGVSGILLYTNNQRTLDENASLEEIEEFVDESKSNTDLSYLLFAIGGFLIAIGNS